MRCDKCGKKKSLRKITETEDSDINWCDNCIKKSDLTELQPMREGGKIMAVNSKDVEGYADYSVDYIDSKNDLQQNQSLIYEVRIKDREKLIRKNK